MKTISERIKEGLEMRGLKQADLVRMTGVNKGALSCYISGKYIPKQDNIYKIAKALNVSEAWLMGADVPMRRIDANVKHPVAVKIPVLGRVSAGIPIEEIEDVIGYEEITDKMTETGDFFALKIKGDSMEPKIHDGDVVIVRKQMDAETGEIVIVTINGEDGTCKRLRKTDDGIMLISFNADYDPITFTKKQIRELPVQIIGKVIESRSKF